MRPTPVATAFLCVMAGCSPEQAPRQWAQARAEIIGGQLDPGDPAVVFLEVANGTCSGTLIAPRTVVTAEHCEQPLRVDFGPDSSAPSRTVRVIAVGLHPTTDLQVVELEVPVRDVVPVALNRTPLGDPDVGRQIRHVGFGLDGYPQGDARFKRHGMAHIEGVYPDALDTFISDGGGAVCFGDSGGAGLMSIDGGVEVLAGIPVQLNSGPLCSGSALDVKVDGFADWITATSAPWEALTCAAGDGCDPTCVPVDTDCVCVFDGLCDPKCPDLAKDPDCPPDCGANGVCSASKCPAPDPDCVPQGGACTAAAMCQSRSCFVQGDKRYCSSSCAADNECPTEMFCSATFHACVFDVSPVVPPKPPDPPPLPPHARGCSSAPGEAGWFAVLGLLSLAQRASRERRDRCRSPTGAASRGRSS